MGEAINWEGGDSTEVTLVAIYVANEWTRETQKIFMETLRKDYLFKVGYLSTFLATRPPAHPLIFAHPPDQLYRLQAVPWSRVIFNTMKGKGCTLGHLVTLGVCTKAQAESFRYEVTPACASSVPTKDFSITTYPRSLRVRDILLDPRRRKVWAMALGFLSGWGTIFTTYVLGGKKKEKKLCGDSYYLLFNNVIQMC